MKKSNLLFSIGVSSFFVYLGYYLSFMKELPSDINPYLSKTVGIICMVFFGAILIMSIKKMFSK